MNVFLFPSSARGSPRNLRVSDETVSSMKVSWEAAPGNVRQYRVAYRPSPDGPRKEVSVRGDSTAALLKNLQPGTPYDVFVSAQYPSGLGKALEGQGTTLEGKCLHLTENLDLVTFSHVYIIVNINK